MEVLHATGEAARPRILDLFETTKPRIGAMVVLTTLVGYSMARASREPFEIGHLVIALLGTALSAAGSCALNQYIERHLDARMERTRTRPLPAGRVTPEEVLVFGVTLSVAGVLLLAFLINPLTAVLSATSVLGYIFVYTPLKRVTPVNTLVGALAGALPPMLGWTAACGEIGTGAVLLFALQFLWQLPHFMAIALLYREDYRAGGFRMLPVVETDPRRVGSKIVIYTILLVIASVLPVITGIAGNFYGLAALILGAGFLHQSVITGAQQTRASATRLLMASLVYLPVLFLAMMADKL